jgi:hypothetical protein
LTSAESEAEKLSSVIGFTAKLADGVAAKVKQLDLAKVRFHLKSKAREVLPKGKD